MTTYKAMLLGSAGAIALSLGLAATSAQAFDNVNWTWNKTIEERVLKDIRIFSEINPTGMTEVEKLQIYIGDVTATSTVHDIYNNPPAQNDGGTVIIDEIFDFSAEYSGDQPSPWTVPVGGTDDGDSPVTATLVGGAVSEGFEEATIQIQVEGEVEVPAGEGDPLDAATELPAVESVAVAVGNNQQIESAVSTQLHDAQILFDVREEDGGSTVPLFALQDGEEEGGNLHTDIALTAALAAAFGFIDKSEITATSEVYNILNATVESSATAVGNNMSVDLSEAPVGDQVLIADITQFAFADVSASSYVHDVSINNYSNLAAVSPIVSSTATAVGNNLSINVGVPDTDE